MKRAYFVHEDDMEYGVAVVANSAKEAKKLSWGHDGLDDAEWTDVRVSWKKGVDVSKLKVGVIENHLLALKLGIYGYVDGEECPTCNHEDSMVYYDDGKYYCSNCSDGGDE